MNLGVFVQQVLESMNDRHTVIPCPDWRWVTRDHFLER